MVWFISMIVQGLLSSKWPYSAGIRRIMRMTFKIRGLPMVIIIALVFPEKVSR